MTAPTREIRHQIDQYIVDGLDGEARALGIDRGDLVARVLKTHVDRQVHVARVLLRFVGGNGKDSADRRNPTDSD